MSSLPADAPTPADAADAPPPPPLDFKRRKIQKMPLMKFVPGGYAARNILPASILPRALNPVYVECEDTRDIPLTWYGILWNSKVLLDYAVKQGWAVRSKLSQLGAYDIVPTWDRLKRHYYAKHGIAIRVRDVWAEQHDRVTKIVTFYHNREMPAWTKKQRFVVFDTLTEMGYMPGEAQWYLDAGEDL
ncbi:hypothetical protein OH76DRAFT_1561832 [Lentinus brumalis]|uniref:Uncharacterized protein n=1 Tax=Lentinus brumalis TaxID=2498619 RepID=A0A371CL72_9APHY|nr:hypothetical protein OH76DRAFT_1561832 [Polyporus brumalis]